MGAEFTAEVKIWSDLIVASFCVRSSLTEFIKLLSHIYEMRLNWFVTSWFISFFFVFLFFYFSVAAQIFTIKTKSESQRPFKPRGAERFGARQNLEVESLKLVSKGGSYPKEDRPQQRWREKSKTRINQRNSKATGPWLIQWRSTAAFLLGTDQTGLASLWCGLHCLLRSSKGNHFSTSFKSRTW